MNNNKIALKVSVNTIIINVFLSAFKLVAGIIACSSAMISDAIHSLSDVFSTFIVIIGVKLAGKEPDKEHPYGHERFECVAAIILSGILLATGVFIGIKGINLITNQNTDNLVTPGLLALIAAIVSVIIKEFMYWYTRWAAKKVNSGALLADAWHHRSDALSSIGSFIGILGARLGLPILDPIASVVIALFIIKVAIDIFKQAVNKMTDHSCDDHIIEEIKSLTLQQKGVLSIDLLTTRIFGDKFYVDIEISADKDISLEMAHEIAHRVHDEIENNFHNIKHCMIHVNPK